MLIYTPKAQKENEFFGTIENSGKYLHPMLIY